MRYQYLNSEYYITRDSDGIYTVREIVLLPGVGKINLARVGEEDQREIFNSWVEDLAMLIGTTIDEVEGLVGVF